MSKQLFSKILALTVAVALCAFVIAPALAAVNSEPFEFERSSSNSGYSLTYLGRGGGSCDSNDYRFRINVYQSSLLNDWKMYSNNSRYQRTPTGRIPYGYNLDTTNAHICIGAQEFMWYLHPLTYWTTDGVQSNVYTWRR